MNSDDTPTPVPDTRRETGSWGVAAQAVEDCERVAVQLEIRAAVLAQAPAISGRPDLSMPRIADKLRRLARRYEAWRLDRTGKEERDLDNRDAALWFAEARAALEAYPAPGRTEPPP